MSHSFVSNIKDKKKLHELNLHDIFCYKSGERCVVQIFDLYNSGVGDVSNTKPGVKSGLIQIESRFRRMG